MRESIVHSLEPIFDRDSKILILGTMPSPKSRESGFYYGHPQNRFWRVLAAVFCEAVPETHSDKKDFLRRHHIALWDVLKSCDIRGAQDSSIRNPKVNDLQRVLSCANIRRIYTTGMRATALYQRYCAAETGMPAVYLPSPSAANGARFTFSDLVEAYQIITKEIEMDEKHHDTAERHRTE